MSDTTTVPTTPTAANPANPAEQTPVEPTFTAPASQADLDRIIADRLSRERAKFADYADLKEKAARADALEEAQKTEQQRQADATAKALKDAEDARAEARMLKAAAKHGVTEDNFDLLGTGSEEAIAARAERVGALIKLQSENQQLKAELDALRAGKPAPLNSRPITDLKPGATPVNAPTEDDELLARLGFGPDI